MLEKEDYVFDGSLMWDGALAVVAQASCLCVSEMIHVSQTNAQAGCLCHYPPATRFRQRHYPEKKFEKNATFSSHQRLLFNNSYYRLELDKKF